MINTTTDEILTLCTEMKVIGIISSDSIWTEIIISAGQQFGVRGYKGVAGTANTWGAARDMATQTVVSFMV